jgi:cell division protein FtsB
MNLKVFLQTPKGQLTAALCALGISWIFLFFYFVGPVGSLFPSKEMISQAQSDLKKLQKENDSLKQRDKELKQLETSYQKLLERSWNDQTGDVATEFRAMIQAAAQKTQLNLNSLGSVKTSKINNELFFAEIDFQAAASMDIIADFLAEVRQIKPAPAWKRFDLRMNRQFPGTSSPMVETLSLNGTLRVICTGNQEAQ